MKGSLEEHHQVVSDLYLRARSLSPVERLELLESQAQRAPEAVTEVRAMLAAENLRVGLLDQRVSMPALAGTHADVTLSQFGRYRILREIGAGGMGSVYEAEQPHPHRTVALKVMRTGMHSAGARQRFEFESSVLGRLRHPGIAQIYDAGVQSVGDHDVPYFVMELVEGAETIRKYVAARKLADRQVIKLLIDACDAVQHGHQRGVIHRDLKPENILVEPNGRIKIIDFGVARALDRDPNEPAHTLDGQLVGTLAYMSPEQLAGPSDDVDIRSDVYALGVVLFELLTGRLPYPNPEPSLAEHLAALQAGAMRLDAAAPRFRGDLTTIVGKALATDREQRYASAADLAADLGRYLHDEPIAARPPSKAYLFRKFAKRHKALVGAGVLVLLTLAAGVFAERLRANQAVAAREQAIAARQEAETEAERANQVVGFLYNMLSKVTPDEARANASPCRKCSTPSRTISTPKAPSRPRSRRPSA